MTSARPRIVPGLRRQGDRAAASARLSVARRSGIHRLEHRELRVRRIVLLRSQRPPAPVCRVTLPKASRCVDAEQEDAVDRGVGRVRRERLRGIFVVAVEQEGTRELGGALDQVSQGVVREQSVMAVGRVARPEHVRLHRPPQPARRVAGRPSRLGVRGDGLVDRRTALLAAEVGRVGRVAEEVDRRRRLEPRHPGGGSRYHRGLRAGIPCQRARRDLELHVLHRDGAPREGGTETSYT